MVAMLGLLAASRRESRLGSWLTKPVASAGFIVAAVGNGAAGDARYGRLILVALALSWLGDVFLIPAGMTWFRLGLVSFLSAHVAFAVAFLRRGVDLRAVGAAAPILTLGAWLIGRWLIPHVEAKMRPPVIAYIVAISAMVALAVGATFATGQWILIAGAVTFFLSDLSVARDTFVKRSFVNRLWGLPLYYGAQLLFAWSVLAR